MGKKEEGTSTAWRERLGLTKEEAKNQFKGRNDDVIILFMGPTGAGKSTFIKEYTGNRGVVVGHQLQSCTRDVTWYEAKLPPGWAAVLGTRRLILVDTPGFDDTFTDDSEILRRVSVWMAQSYNCDAPVAGIIYMNDITQTRMLGSTRMNLNMFTKLCGEGELSKVVLATSQWDQLPNPHAGVERERDLKAKFWEHLVKGGANVMSIRQKPSDQHTIINHLLDNFVNRLGLKPGILQIQSEIVDLEKSIPATKAGQELKLNIEELVALQKTLIENALDEKGKKELVRRRELLKEQLKGLKLSSSERFKRFLGRG